MHANGTETLTPTAKWPLIDLSLIDLSRKVLRGPRVLLKIVRPGEATLRQRMPGPVAMTYAKEFNRECRREGARAKAIIVP